MKIEQSFLFGEVCKTGVENPEEIALSILHALRDKKAHLYLTETGYFIGEKTGGTDFDVLLLVGKDTRYIFKNCIIPAAKKLHCKYIIATVPNKRFRSLLSRLGFETFPNSNNIIYGI